MIETADFSAPVAASTTGHGLEWMIRCGGMDAFAQELTNDTIRFAWPT